MADRRLQIFHAVATHLNFTRAAEALFMSQPAVTLQIKQLEDEYRTRLLERSPQGVELTPAGQIVFEYATQILALGREMDGRLAELTEEISGELRIGAATTLADEVLPPLLAEFNALFPKVRVVLVAANSEAVQRQVGERSLALGLIDATGVADGLIGVECGGDELVLICDTEHPLARQRSATAKALADYEYIARETGSGTREASDVWFAAQGVDPLALKLQMVLGSTEALRSVVAGGLGYAIISRLAAERDTRAHGLRIVGLKPELRRTFRLVYPEARYRPRVVAAFIDFIQRRLRELYA